jgi:anti-sigma factor RsiW
MNTHLTHDEIRTLLAPFALDAVDPDESEAVEQHLRECPSCRAEVADFRETAAALAATFEPAPSSLWQKIEANFDDDAGDHPPRLLPLARPGHDRRVQAVAASVAAAAIAVIALLGIQVVQQGDEVDRMEAALDERTLLASALAAQTDPDGRQVELRSPDGVVLANAVLLPSGTGYLVSALPEVDDDRTYQLWAVMGTEKISAGVLGPDPRVVPFQAAGDVSALAITEEAAGGVVASQNPAVAIGAVDDA